MTTRSHSRQRGASDDPWMTPARQVTMLGVPEPDRNTAQSMIKANAVMLGSSIRLCGKVSCMRLWLGLGEGCVA
jgi:hypothetical protein